MDVKELRTFNVDELKARIRQWRDELFRSKFKAESSESKDTSVFRKLKKDIARGETILTERLRQGGVVTAPKTAASPGDKPVTAAEDKPAAAPKKTRKVASKAAKVKGE